MPTPVPRWRYTKLSTSLPNPCQRSPSAARFTSFSNAVFVSSSACPSRPGPRAPTRAGCTRGHLPSTGLEHTGTPDRRERHLRPPDAGIGRQPVRDRADLRDERAGTLHPCALVAASDELPGQVGDRGTDPISPDVEADQPAGARIQFVQHGGGSFPPVDRPASWTRPRAPGPASACETVGLDRAVSRAIWAREIGPRRGTDSRTVRSLIARSRLGVPTAGASRSKFVVASLSSGASAKETFLTIRADATLGP